MWKETFFSDNMDYSLVVAKLEGIQQWEFRKKTDYILRNKMTFDFHQTNPQLDIQPTGHC